MIFIHVVIIFSVDLLNQIFFMTGDIATDKTSQKVDLTKLTDFLNLFSTCYNNFNLNVTFVLTDFWEPNNITKQKDA